MHMAMNACKYEPFWQCSFQTTNSLAKVISQEGIEHLDNRMILLENDGQKSQ